MITLDEKNKNIALVLSGGGARGIAHIGVIEVMLEHGLTIQSVAGTSMGALVAGAYAVGNLSSFKEWLLSLDKIKVFNLIDFSFGDQGLIKGDRVFNKIKAFIPEVSIESLPFPYLAVAVDIIHSTEVVFNEGSLFKAIRASVAIPTVLTPVKSGEQLLVDGGVINNIPLNHIIRHSGDHLIAVDVNADLPYARPNIVNEESDSFISRYQRTLGDFYRQLKKDKPANIKETQMGYFELLNKTIGLLRHQNDLRMIEKYPPDLLIEVSRDAANTFDFYKAEELIAHGREVAEKALREWKV